MKANLKTIFEHNGKYITGHIEDVEMYADVISGKKFWKDTIYSRITHIRVPKEIFERLLNLDRKEEDGKPSEGEWHTQCLSHHDAWNVYLHICKECSYFYKDVRPYGYKYCPNCGLKMKGGAE